MNVSAFYPGASAQVASDVVTRVLERQINGVPGMSYILSDATSAGEATAPPPWPCCRRW